MGNTYEREDIPPGIWDVDLDAHPDAVYEFEFHGYKCVIKRNLSSFTYTAYVHLPTTHPDYHTDYSNLRYPAIRVHGDLTYGKEGVFGFDCHHMLMGDLSPVDQMMAAKESSTQSHINSFLKETAEAQHHYWTFEEVRDELKNLARQFKQRET